MQLVPGCATPRFRGFNPAGGEAFIVPKANRHFIATRIFMKRSRFGFHKFSTIRHGNVMRAIRVVSLWSLMFVNAVQESPTLLNTNLQLRLVLNTPTTSQSVRIAKDPRNNQLYYLQINGDIYQVNLTNSTSAKVYSSVNHGLSNSVEGLAIGPGGTMYVLGDFSTTTTSNGDYGYIRIMKGVPNGSGVRVWSLLAQTDLWQRSKGQFDHNCSALIV